jgi:hypothetical protein
MVSSGLVGAFCFVDSVSFTAAADLQYVESINANSGPRAAGHVRLVAWQPARLGWWITAVRLVGTVLFNLNTALALQQGSLCVTSRLPATDNVPVRGAARL